MHPDLDVIILGGGIAGLSAAQLLGRARRRTLVIDAGKPRNRTASHVHGVLGHDGTPPADLLARGRDEASGYGVGVIEARAVAVEATDDDITVVTDDGARRTARALLVATGASDVLPAVAGLSERWGAGVLHCPYCHGWEVRDRRLGVLATSPRSLHQAQLVRQWSADVTLFTADLGPLSIDDDLRLRARGIRLVPQRVVEIVGDGPDVTGVRLADGTMLALDAVFTGGDLTPHDDVLAGLDLPRVDSPTGSVIEVDAAGRTAHPRIWAAGNVVTPMASVPMSMAAGATAGAAVNAALVDEDVARVHADRDRWPEIAPADFWEHRYAASTQVWSGRVNAVLADIAATLPAGSALDLGCGEGGDVLWLAAHGWRATGIDISVTAIGRARAAAADAGADAASARFVAGDLAALDVDETFDLVTASFLHSPVDLPREEILRAAAERVAPGGHLLITSHAAPPPGSPGAGHGHGHGHDGHHPAPGHDREGGAPHDHGHGGARHPDPAAPARRWFPTPAEDVAALALDPAEWTVLIAEERQRESLARDGELRTFHDGIVLARRH